MAANVKIIKKSDDQICMRASIGGGFGMGFYCVYRGDKLSVISMLKKVINALEGETNVEKTKKNNSSREE